jgi:hypothetical protein
VTNFLTDTLNEAFGRGARKTKQPPATKVVAIFNGVEQTVAKDRNGLWTVTFEGERYQNSKLGDLILQIESFGGTVERRAL